MTAPAPLTRHVVDGLAVTRRRPRDATAASPTLILVHGAMDRAASFGRTMRRLGDIDVVAYDRRGYAESTDAGVAPTIEAHADDLARVARWTGAESVVVVGHSLGGTVAVALAALDDRRVAAVAAFESPFPLLDDSFDQVGGGAVQVAARDGDAAGAEHFYRLMVGDDTWSRLRDRDRAARRAEGPALMAELIDLRRRDRAVDPADARVPVLVGMGGLSSAGMRGSAVRLAQHLGGPDPDVIELAGHGAHLTHPDEYARFCRDAAALVGHAPSRSRSH